jgi:hypothetical protein
VQIFSTDVGAALAAGFGATDLIVNLGAIGWSDAVDQALRYNVDQFYIDEPYGNESF